MSRIYGYLTLIRTDFGNCNFWGLEKAYFWSSRNLGGRRMQISRVFEVWEARECKFLEFLLAREARAGTFLEFLQVWQAGEGTFREFLLAFSWLFVYFGGWGWQIQF